MAYTGRGDVPEQNGSSSSGPNPRLRCTALGDASQQMETFRQRGVEAEAAQAIPDDETDA